MRIDVPRILSAAAILMLAVGAEPSIADETAAAGPARCLDLQKPAATEAAPAAEPTAFETIDRVFGEIAVAPLASLLFWDIIFWDNELSAAEGAALVGKSVKGHEVVEWNPEQGLVGRKVYRAKEDRLVGVVPEHGEGEPEPLPLAVGRFVRVGDAACVEVDHAEVLAIGADGTVELKSELRSPLGKANPSGMKLPFIVAWLVVGAIYFTLRMGFINLRGFSHAVAVVRGHYDHPDDPGEVNHFQALSSALSATVGLGNIAGVAIAVSTGGPGAVFWMIMAGFLGMSSKFVECTLGQMYRHVDELGVVSGGPMRYLEAGLREKNLGGFGKVLALVFSVMCIGGSFGGGNMFQANQAFAATAERFPAIADHAWVFGVVLAVLVGLVIIGGIKRIGAAASYLVPAMCGIYLAAGVFVLLSNLDKIGWAFSEIFSQAFSPDAAYGGVLGALIVGFQRAAFSNEAGVGSASIAHAAASTNEPIREGLVALLEPFIDTIVVCTMTALVVVITGTYNTPGADGVVITSMAFGQTVSWFPWILTLAVILFAFSTMISWSYYGERCFTLLFGEKSSMIYRFIFCFFVFFGAVFKLGNVLDFSDLMILGMAFPNIFGLVILSGKVRGALDDYMGRLKAGKMPIHR